MTTESTGDRTTEERLNAVEQVLMLITDRQANVDGLKEATESLNESTAGVGRVLTNVATAMSAAKTAQTTADDANIKIDQQARNLVATEAKYRRHTRRYAALALIISLLAAAYVGYREHVTANALHNFAAQVHTRCETRIRYDRANHESVGADVTYLQAQLDQEKQNRPEVHTLIMSFPPDQRPVLRATEKAGRQSLKAALAEKRKAFAAGVIGTCSQLH